MNEDAFALNIDGVRNLVGSRMNKTGSGDFSDGEGVSGDYEDDLSLKMDDSDLLRLKQEWEIKSQGYLPKIKVRQDRNKLYYQGKQEQSDDEKVVSSNLIFEAQETFIPQALSKNPEPVVFSDNTSEGKDASNDIKTMLQYHADTLNLRSKLATMLRHWSIYFIGVAKHGWDQKVNDIDFDIRKPQNFILDPEGYIDDYGNFVGAFLGERIKCSAKVLIELYPEKKDYILVKVDGKLGTEVTRTEWWTDEYCFTTFEDIVLDKHKNEFFNYDTTESETDEYGEIKETVTPGQNHFAVPKMPYTFLSIFSLQDQPYDITNLIEQNIPNQDRITEREKQISKNLKSSNNSIAVSGDFFTSETAHQAAEALEDGDPVLVPSGSVDAAIKRIPANDIPSSVFNAQNNDKIALRSVFGVQGLAAQPQTSDTTARGMILNQNHDASRIGGGVGDKLEQVADNIFNWWVQLYYVFYDDAHYGAIMGSGRAVEYVRIIKTDINRRFVVSVSANSMQPKDEITEQNLAIQLANTGWLDPITLFKKLNYPDPLETAKMVTMWKINPQQYFATFFPEAMQPQEAGQISENPLDVNQIPTPVDQSLANPPASASLSQVPINSLSMPK